MNSVKKIEELKKLIKNRMELILKVLCSENGASDDETSEGIKKLLKELGLPPTFGGLIKNSYLYGKLRILNGKGIENLSEDEINELIQKLKTSPGEQKSIAYLNMKAEERISQLTAKISSSAITKLLESQIKMYMTIKEVFPEALRNKTERFKIIQELREQSEDWNRDWYRTAQTEMWDAKLYGEAQAIKETRKGDVILFKRPGTNSCKKCKELYLESDGITPKLFKMSEMLEFGSNYGLKQANWKPVLETAHPNCMCPLSVMPNGYHFDKNGKLLRD